MRAWVIDTINPSSPRLRLYRAVTLTAFRRWTHHRSRVTCGQQGWLGCEFVIAVADKWQSRGVGSALAQASL
jgi:hypothetical protein